MTNNKVKEYQSLTLVGSNPSIEKLSRDPIEFSRICKFRMEPNKIRSLEQAIKDVRDKINSDYINELRDKNYHKLMAVSKCCDELVDVINIWNDKIKKVIAEKFSDSSVVGDTDEVIKNLTNSYANIKLPKIVANPSIKIPYNNLESAIDAFNNKNYVSKKKTEGILDKSNGPFDGKIHQATEIARAEQALSTVKKDIYVSVGSGEISSVDFKAKKIKVVFTSRTGEINIPPQSICSNVDAPAAEQPTSV